MVWTLRYILCHVVFFPFYSVRSRLISLIALAVVPIFGLALYSASEHRNLAAEDAKKEAMSLVHLALDKEAQLVESSRQLLIASSKTNVVLQTPESCNEFVARVIKGNSAYTNLGVARVNGDVYCSAVPPSRPVNLSDRPYFKAILATKAFQPSEYHFGKITNKPVLTMAHPVTDKTGVLKAVLFLTVDLNWIQSALAEVDAPEGYSLTVIERNGTVLARHPDGKNWVGKSVAGMQVTKRFIAGKEGVAEGKGLAGEPRLFAFATTADGRISVVVSVPQTVVFAEVTRISEQALWGIGIVGLITLLTAWVGSQWSILRPINSLIATSEQLSAGNLRARTELPSQKGEFGRLATAFDLMTKSLERRYTELETLRNIDLGILSTLDLESTLQHLLDKIEVYLPHSAATVRLYNAETGRLEPAAWRNLQVYQPDSSGKDRHKTLPHLVFEHKAPLAIADIASTKTEDRDSVVQQGFKSYLGIPLAAKGESIGVLSFYSKGDAAFSVEEIDFLTTVGGQASIAINNSILYERVKLQAVELEASNKIKDEFLSVMSHELRTPVNIITGYTTLLSQGILGDINNAQMQGLEKIGTHSSALLNMINQILAATTIEAQSLQPKWEAVNVGALLDDLKSSYDVLLKKKCLALNWNYRSDIPEIKTDRTKLEQILQNLIGNAIKFTEEGSVDVSAVYDAASDRIEFIVTDTGIGIPTESHEELFDKFHQLDSSDTRNFEGIGLGLYIAKKFTTLLGGTLVLKESEPGRGSTFAVILPRCDFAQAELHQMRCSQEPAWG